MSSTVLTIGNFDGVHLGHAALLAVARRLATNDGRVVALTFDPFPSEILGIGGNEPLTTLDRRCELLELAGADDVHIEQIDGAWLQQDPEIFIDQLVAAWSPAALVEGPDFRFGRDRAGDVALLRSLGSTRGFVVETVDAVEAPLSNLHRAPVRSSLIRWLLKRGRVRDAAALLGRPWRIEGTVVSGDRRGRTLACPTANLDHGQLLLPMDGVYAGVARCPEGVFPAAVSVSDKPTFQRTPRLLEAHLIGWDGTLDQYGWYLEVDLLHWVRDQVRFDSPQLLQDQLRRDFGTVSRLVGETPASTLRRS